MTLATLLCIVLPSCYGLVSSKMRILDFGRSKTALPTKRQRGLYAKAGFSCDIAGVSVSPKGFHVMLRDEDQLYCGIPVTRQGQDARSATTPQALTILQLLASVDMAGAVLPPELLSQLTVVLSESDSELAKFVENSIAKILASLGTKVDSLKYMEQSPWVQAKVRLPTTTLEDIIVISKSHFLLSCAVEGYGRYTIALEDSNDLWKDLLYEPSTVTAAFAALALALRYNTPISAEVDNDLTFLDETTLRSQFPSYQSANEVLEPADRSAEHIARGFEINTLQAALRMAMDRNDVKAATKIRAELDRLDHESMKDLPVQPETDINSMQ